MHHQQRHRFYLPARPLLQWGEKEAPMHASWGDLFYDLIMVGAAYRCGSFFAKNIHLPIGPWVLIGTALTVLSSWSHLLQYRSRFVAKSGLHKLVDVLEGLSAAASAHNIVADIAAFESYHMYAFLWMVMINRGVQLGRRLELVLQRVPHGESTSTRLAALDMFVRTLLEMGILSSGFAVSRIEHMTAILIGAWLFNVLLVLVPAALSCYSRRNMVPVHVEFTCRRMGEMVMLMIGEGMLALVLSEYNTAVQPIVECRQRCWVEKCKSATSFVSAYIVMISIMWCHFRSNRFEPHDHAVRLSSIRGIAWSLSHWPLSIALIGGGVSLKALHPMAASAKVDPAFVNTFCICIAFSLLTIWFDQLMHPGLVAMWSAPRHRCTRLSLFGAKLVLVVVAFAELGFPETTEGYAYVLFMALVCLASALLVILEKSPTIDRGLWHYVHRHNSAASSSAQLQLQLELNQVVLSSTAHDVSSTALGHAHVHARTREQLVQGDKELDAAAGPKAVGSVAAAAEDWREPGGGGDKKADSPMLRKKHSSSDRGACESSSAGHSQRPARASSALSGPHEGEGVTAPFGVVLTFAEDGPRLARAPSQLGHHAARQDAEQSHHASADERDRALPAQHGPSDASHAPPEAKPEASGPSGPSGREIGIERMSSRRGMVPLALARIASSATYAIGFGRDRDGEDPADAETESETESNESSDEADAIKSSKSVSEDINSAMVLIG